MAFKNKHLSYSRLSRFEQCPLSFKLHYIDEQEAEPGVALRFGKGIHTVLERLLLHHKEKQRGGVLDANHAVELWQQVWAEAGLSGVDVFEEGLDILKGFVRDQGVVDWQDVLAIEDPGNAGSLAPDDRPAYNRGARGDPSGAGRRARPPWPRSDGSGPRRLHE